MPHTLPACPQCGQENTYPDGSNYICPDCAFEWPQQADAAEDEAPGGDGTVRRMGEFWKRRREKVVSD